jgi:acetylornithine deacetylase/succinyl-diaminopimelate desuccinylase-like protein
VKQDTAHGPARASASSGVQTLARSHVDKSTDRKPLPSLHFRIAAAVGLIVWAAAGPVDAAAGTARQWGDEAAELLAQLIRIDTTNPPGGETAAARALARHLAAAGIPSEVIESSPGRGNLYARLPGSGQGRPIVLLSHLDVVPADPRGWHVPPFAGLRKDGYVWGRGAIDCKGVTAVEATALIALARSGERLGRDVILLATADEETGGAAGAGWLTHHRPDLVGQAEYVVNEGDDIHVLPDGRRVVEVAIAEKAPCWVRITATGDAGHGAVPPRETAVTRLVRALERLRRYSTPVRLTPAVEAYFAALAPLEPEPLRTRLLHLRTALEDPPFLAEFTRNPRQNALVRDTITPTVLRGSSKTNVIPAELDCRLLPGETPAAFVGRLAEVIGDDSVHLEPLLAFAASASDPESGLVAAVREMARRELGGAPVVPSVIPGFTDSHYFRDLGIASYGFVPFALTDADERTVHGIDERISVDNLGQGVRRLLALLRALPRPS